MNMSSLYRIGILSDTHGSLPERVFRLFSGQWSDAELQRSQPTVITCSFDRDGAPHLIENTDSLLGPDPCDLILHGGDIGPQLVLDELGAIAPTIAVLGNNDYERYWCSDGEVRPFRTFEAGGITIALQHRPEDLRVSLRGKSPLQPKLAECEVDLAIHGHTHVPRIQQEGNRIMLCPGSPTRARNGSGHHVAIVDLEDSKIQRLALINL